MGFSPKEAENSALRAQLAMRGGGDQAAASASAQTRSVTRTRDVVSKSHALPERSPVAPLHVAHDGDVLEVLDVDDLASVGEEGLELGGRRC